MREFLPVFVHLVLLLAACFVYHIEEGHGLQVLFTIATAALPIHYFLPFHWKKPLFVAISLAGLAAVFGGQVAFVVLLVGAALIGICYLPINWLARVAMVAALTGALALARSQVLPVRVPGAVWPVLGALFMFRMIIFLYELKHAHAREKLIDVLSYFFMLPNYAFLLFPVVDYKTFLRGYFAADIHVTQRRGLAMMTRGLTHLLLYRWVYHDVLISESSVHGPLSLVGHLVFNYLLYLRVSGQFHIACGMLHLFGFQLPDTHHHYFLATGFTDYWRRINIYWKDFMVRIVFNPIVFRLKRRPQLLAVGIGTVAVFVTTWALHAYQSFWLRGSWGFSVPDALFWGILGFLVLINVVNDMRTARRPRGRGLDRSPRALAVRGLKIVGTFTTLALLWSLWYSPSLSAWLAMLRRGCGGA